MGRLLKYLPLFIVLVMFFSRVTSAATVSPSLQRVLQSAPVGQEIPVIITLSAKADLTSIKDKAKVKRRESIVRALKDEAAKTQGPLRSLLQNRGARRVIPLWITNSIAATISPVVISELMSFPGIESIEPDGVTPSPVVTPAAASTPEWNIAKINAPALWDAGITGAGVVVANMDTGVDINHPDVQPGWRGGADSWFNPYSEPGNSSYCGIPGSCTVCELDSTIPCDDNGHGTGTMGIMVGGSAGGTAIGVAPDAKWIAVKIFPSPPAKAALNSIILQGFQWLIGLPAGSAPDVLNNSWGGDPNVCDTTFLSAVGTLKTAGIEVVFAAGNKGPVPSTSESPANNPGSFAVGATYDNDVVASFSSRGPSACDGSTFPHVVAPGVSVKTANIGSGGGLISFQYGTGTSFSAPHVAGAAALLLSAFPSLIPEDIEMVLETTAVPLGAPIPNNDYGYGRIDVSAALSYLTTHGNIAIPEIAGYAAAYDYGNVAFDGASPSHTFTLTNRSGGALTINSVTPTGTDGSEFAVSGDACTGATLDPSASCSFTVSLAFTTTGPENALLSISYGTPAVIYDIPLSGYVVDRVIRKRGGTVVATYSTIQAAFDDCAIVGHCVAGDVVAARTEIFAQLLEFNAPVSVGLEGGYDPSFSVQSDFTTITGSLTITDGTVTIGNVILQ